MDNKESYSGNGFSDKELENSVVIPVIEERLRVDKKTVESGRVIITRKVHEETEMVDLPLESEEVDVQRIPVNQYIDNPPPAIRYENDKTIIPVLKEVLVVEKRLMLVEEVHITKKSVTTTSAQPETIRREEIIVTGLK